MKRYWLSSVSHNTILCQIPPMSWKSIENVLIKAAKELNNGGTRTIASD